MRRQRIGDDRLTNRWARRWRNATGEADRGDTLVELLIAMVILAITVAALLGALIASTAGSVEHRSLASLDSILKSFADSVQDPDAAARVRS